MNASPVATPRIDPSPAESLVVLAASVGGLKALQTILAELPPNFPAAVMIVQHRTSHRPNLLGKLLQTRTPLQVVDARECARLEAGTIYVVPPDRHATIEAPGTIHLADGRRIHHVRSSANPLLDTAAVAFGGHLIAVVLTGRGRNGADGLTAVRREGGAVLVQEPATAEAPDMPKAAIDTGSATAVLPLELIGAAITSLVTNLHERQNGARTL